VITGDQQEEPQDREGYVMGGSMSAVLDGSRVTRLMPRPRVAHNGDGPPPHGTPTISQHRRSQRQRSTVRTAWPLARTREYADTEGSGWSVVGGLLKRRPSRYRERSRSWTTAHSEARRRTGDQQSQGCHLGRQPRGQGSQAGRPGHRSGQEDWVLPWFGHQGNESTSNGYRC